MEGLSDVMNSKTMKKTRPTIPRYWFTLAPITTAVSTMTTSTIATTATLKITKKHKYLC